MHARSAKVPGFPGGSPAGTASAVGGHGVGPVAPPQLLIASTLADGGYYAPNINCELPPSVSQPSTEGACVHGGCGVAKAVGSGGKGGVMWVDDRGDGKCCWLTAMLVGVR